MAEALAKAEELNGPELAAKFRSQPRDPLAARLQVMSLFWVPLVIQKLLSWSQHISHFFLQAQNEENTSGFIAPRRRVAKPHIRMVDKVQSLELASLLLYPVACSLFTVSSSLYTVQVNIYAVTASLWIVTVPRTSSLTASCSPYLGTLTKGKLLKCTCTC